MTRDAISGLVDCWLEAWNRRVAYVEWSALATHAGEFHGIPPTGRRVESDGCNVLRVGADGLFDSEISYWDVAGLLRQFGLLPELPE